jgi:4'-phosphopantetheinyl transferase
MNLHVVIRDTPGQDLSTPSADRVAHQKRAAREALMAAAVLHGYELIELPRDEHGAPLPENGHYWSITHTRDLVAGATAPWPVGVDVERVRRVSDDVRDEAASNAELMLVAARFEETLEEAFTRIWSAKEAFLKLTGEGLGGLSRCLVAPNTAIEGRPGVWIRSGDREHFVHQERRGAHYVSLACESINYVHWEWQTGPTHEKSERQGV